MPKDASRSIALSLDMAKTMSAQGRWSKAIGSYKEVLRLLAGSSPGPLVVRIHLDMGDAYAASAQPLEAEQSFQVAEQLAATLGNAAMQAAAMVGLGEVCASRGQWQLAKRHHRRALDLWRQQKPAAAAEAISFRGLGVAHLHSGELEDAETNLRRSLEIDEQLGQHSGAAQTRMSLGTLELQRGHGDEAMAEYQCAYEGYQRSQDRHGMAQADSNIGMLHLNRQELEQAESSFLRALPVLDEVGDRRSHANVLGNLGSLHALRGELAQAMSRFRSALEVFREYGGPEVQRTEACIRTIEEQMGGV